MLGVVEAHPCINSTAVYRPVVGMLLHYADGHRESIGQVRLGWVVEPIVVTELEKLCLHGKRTEKSWGYVAYVTTEPPARLDGSNWLEVGRAGILEWWFSSRHSVLFYSNTRLN